MKGIGGLTASWKMSRKMQGRKCKGDEPIGQSEEVVQNDGIKRAAGIEETGSTPCVWLELEVQRLKTENERL